MEMATERVYANLTPLVEEALECAAGALELKADSSLARRATAWIEYGYQQWVEKREHEARIAAYREMALDGERLDAIRRSTRDAVAAGLL